MKNTILLLLGILAIISCHKTKDEGEVKGSCDLKTVFKAPGGYTIQSVGTIDFSGFKVESFQFVNEAAGYVMATNTGGYVRLLKTVDGGKNWTDVYINILHYPRGMAFRDENYGLISVYDVTGCPNNCADKCAALKTENGGNSWVIIEYPNLLGYLHHLQFDEAGQLYATLSYGTQTSIVHSDDGGATFNTLYQAPDLVFAISTFSFQLYQDKIYASGTGGSILVINKNGDLLKTIQAPLSTIWDLKVIDEDNLVVAFTGAVLKTTDGGNSWQSIFDGSARLIDFSTPEKGLILKSKSYCPSDIYQANDLFAATNDGGKNWIEPDETTTNLAIFFSNSQKIAAGRYMMFFREKLLELKEN